MLGLYSAQLYGLVYPTLSILSLSLVLRFLALKVSK
jgi:hypothetical protein